MAHESTFGFRPLTEPKPGQTTERVAGGTIYRHCIVDLSSTGTVTCRADDESTDSPFGVALNYAASGENVTICYDPNMLYVTTYTLDPDDLSADIGQWFITATNDTVKDAMNPHMCQGVISTASATFTLHTHSCQLLGWYKHPERVETGASRANLVVVRVLSEFASLPITTGT